MRSKRVVCLSVLPGEPRDGSGKQRIHLFVQDDAGAFTEPHVLHGDGEVSAGPAKGRLACDSKRDATVKTRGNVITVTQRTDDPRATTCPRCIASAYYSDMMSKITVVQQ